VHIANAREVHAAFRQAYGLRQDEGPPLMSLDLSAGRPEPFTLA